MLVVLFPNFSKFPKFTKLFINAPSVSLVSLVCSCRWTLVPKARKAETCHKPLLCQRQGFGVECKYIYPLIKLFVLDFLLP